MLKANKQAPTLEEMSKTEPPEINLDYMAENPPEDFVLDEPEARPLGGIYATPVTEEEEIEPTSVYTGKLFQRQYGMPEPFERYMRQVPTIGEQEAVERYYETHPEMKPRKYKNFIDELLRNMGGGALNVASGLTGTLATASEGAIWDKEQLDKWAWQLHQKGKESAFTPAEGGGWKGFVAASVGQAAPYMGAAVGATMLTGTPLAAFGVGFSVEGDNAYRDAIEAGASEEDAQMNRFIVGTINGAIERMQVSQVMKFAKAGRGSAKGILRTASDRAWKKVLAKGGKIGYEAAKHSAREALEEVLQETTQIIAISKHDPTVWDTASQRILMSGLGGATVGLLLGGGGRVMTNLRARAEAGKLSPQQLEVMNKRAASINKIIEEGGVEALEKVKTEVQDGKRELAALEGEEAAAGFEAEIAEMDAELAEIQRPARVAPEAPPEPFEVIPPPETKEVAPPPEAEAVLAESPVGEAKEKTTPAEPTVVKEPWEMTWDEYLQLERKEISPEALKKIDKTMGIKAPANFVKEAANRHYEAVEEAVAEGKPIPRKVLEEYKSEKWAQEALAKPEVAEKPAEVKAKIKEVKAEVPEGELSRRPVTVEGRKYYPIALPTGQIGVDAAKFQFKLGAKLVGGVTEALKGVEKFDPVKGGQILVWQDNAGKYWVVDGHHRVALAKKTGAETLETWVVREGDGVTEQKARAIGALRNLADGKGTVVDAAKLFRDSDITLAELRKNAVPTESIVVQQGLDMADLSDEVFRLVIDERLPANMAATIGKQVKKPVQQKQVADLILEGEVETLRQAELLAATIDSAPILTKTEQTLFGLETTEKSLYAERAKVLANVEKKLKTNKKVFGVLATQTGIIEAKGNILAKVENLATKEKAEEVLFMLEKLANSKGPVAEALNDATKQYAENPTKENLSKVTDVLLERWTEGPGRLRIPEREAVPELPLERVAPKIKGKPGFIDVRPLEKALNTFLKTVEPAKITERAFGKKPGAIIIKGIHQADVGRIEFNEAEIEALDSNLNDFGEKLSRYSNKILKNLMAARGKPVGKGAVFVKNEALKDLAKEAPELVGVRKMITRIADHNYKYLQSVVGDDIHYVEDYFYGIYKDPDKVERFLDYWKTTDRFTKQKKLPTVADAIAFGLDLRDYNPVNNLRSEYMAIARLDGMIYMRDELMRTGKGRYIDTKEEAPHDWEKIKEPVFKDVRVHPEAAVMIKSLLSTNKLRQHWALRGLTHTNNALRTLKFMFSMFHQLNIGKQSIADEGYLQFLQPSATRGITRGFKKSDPIFRTPAYKDYIRHGGGHRYSIESQAARMVSNFVESLDRRLGLAFKVGALPIRIPKTYVKWLFQSYIPKVKYSKYLDSISQFEEKNGRTPTSTERIEIIKEGQNFYGMMNERLFGRSATVTSLMRLWYMSPGYFEGNLRSTLKSILQWGGKEGFRANRSRSNIINSLLLSGIVATVTTLIMTGKPPKVPETREDLRDLFKGDTGKVDDKGRKIMVDFLTYDKDYWNILGQTLIGKPDKAAEAVIKRGGGMVAPTAQVALDIANMAAGRALVDWKNDRVTEITDPFARQVLKIAIHEIKRIEPISVSVYGQSRRRDQTAVLSALTSLLGYRPTLTEKDKWEQEVLHRIYSLKGQQEKLYQYLGGLRDPRKAVEKYNRNVKTILDSPMTPKIMKVKWEPKLVIDIERLLENKIYTLGGVTQKSEDIERAIKYLKNFGVTQGELENYIRRKRARETKKTPISPLDRDRVIGLIRRIRRAKERWNEHE